MAIACTSEAFHDPVPAPLPRNSTSPVHRLPLELFQEILLHDSDVYIPRRRGGHIVTAVDVFGPIDAVGQVCRSWRNASHSLHRLWSSIFIHIPAHIMPCRNPLARLRTILELSHSPLHVTFLISASECNVNTELVHNTLEILMEQSLRWRSLTLLNISIRMLHALSAIKGQTPLLRSVEIETQLESLSRQRFQAFELAPQLSYLFVDGVPLHLLALNSPKLVHLQTRLLLPHPPSSVSLLDILETSPLIESVDIDQPSLRIHAEDLSVIEHSSLTRLHTTEVDSFPLIELPNLTDLRVSMPTYFQDLRARPSVLSIVPAITDLLQRSKCEVTTLGLHDLDLDGAAFEDLLYQLDGLETLTIGYTMSNYIDPGMDKRVNLAMRALVGYLKNQTCLPRLKTLVFCAYTTGAFFDSAFVDILDKRRLRVVDMEFKTRKTIKPLSWFVGEEKEKRLLELIHEHGMQVRVKLSFVDGLWKWVVH